MIKFNMKEMIARKAFEEKRSISLSDVAEATGIGPATISRMANSKGDYHCSTSQIEKLCRYFGCTPNDLIRLVPDIETPGDDAETEPGA